MCEFVRMFILLHPKDERKVKILQLVMLMIRYGGVLRNKNHRSPVKKSTIIRLKKVGDFT